MEKLRMRKVAFKAFAMVLSMMLAVTCIVPTFATDGKADKEGKHAAVSKAKAGKEDAKINKARSKRVQTFNLNESGNVKVTLDGEKNVNVTATDESADMKVERDKWIEMVKALGGSYAADEISWENADVKDINFRNTKQIYLPEDSVGLFSRFKGDINGCNKLNTENVTDMEGMFSMTKKANPDVSNWDLTNVKDISYMFYRASNAKPDVSNWNTANVTDMGSAFYDASSANPDVSKWNTSNVTNMKGMFDRAGNADPDVSNWDTSKVTDMEDMFSGVVNGNPDVSNWDTSSVTDMQSMFFRTEKANPDVSKWNISNVTNMYEMFQEAKAANPEVSNWDTSKVENMSRMFYFASNATPNVKNWNTPNVTDMSGMFKGAEKANPDVSNWDILNVTDMKDMFSGSGIKKADLSKWKLNKDGSNGTLQSGHMFDGCEALEYLKTPAGLGTIVKGGNYDFKIIRLKKGDPVTIEKENQNFGGMESAYVINAADDKEAVYHVYRKDKYVGVTFDKNGGDTECWFNHEIVEKGKTFNAGGGRFPSQKPTKKEHVCVGWAKNAKATKPNIIKNTVVDKDVTAYAVYKLEVPKLKMKVRVKKIRKGRKRIKVRVLTLRFRPSKAASGYEAKVVIRGKVRKIKLKKGRKKLKGFIVGKIVLPRRGKGFLYFRGFKKIKGKKHYGIQIKKLIK